MWWSRRNSVFFQSLRIKYFPPAFPNWAASLSEHPASGRGEKTQTHRQKPTDIFLISCVRISSGFLQYLTHRMEETAWIWGRMSPDKLLPLATFAKPRNTLMTICFILVQYVLVFIFILLKEKVKLEKIRVLYVLYMPTYLLLPK